MMRVCPNGAVVWWQWSCDGWMMWVLDGMDVVWRMVMVDVGEEEEEEEWMMDVMKDVEEDLVDDT